MRRILLVLLLAFPLHAATFRSHDGTVLHYEVIGKGRRTVILLSGGPGFSPEYLKPIASRLGRRTRFVLLHQRGTGKSVLDKYDVQTLSLANLVGDLEALRQELRLEKVTLAGHSFGGILSMMYAREHPDRIAALAFIDSGGPTLRSVPKFSANLESRFTPEDREQIRKWSEPETVQANRPLAVLELTKAKTPAYFADRAKAHLLTDAMDEASFRDSVFFPIVAQMMALDLRAGLDKVTVPVLIVHGRQDPLESAEELRETFPHARMVMIENAGHFPWLENPRPFYRALRGFLER